MASYDVLDRVVVDEWGEQKGRTEVQAVHETESDKYEVRMPFYQDNGRYGRNAATISPDVNIAERTAEAILEMSEVAREHQKKARVRSVIDSAENLEEDEIGELLTLVEEMGIDEVKDRLTE